MSNDFMVNDKKSLKVKLTFLVVNLPCMTLRYWAHCSVDAEIVYCLCLIGKRMHCLHLSLFCRHG